METKNDYGAALAVYREYIMQRDPVIGVCQPDNNINFGEWLKQRIEDEKTKSQSACEHVFMGCALTGKNCKTRGETKCERCDDKPETKPPSPNKTNCPHCARITNIKVNGFWYCLKCEKEFAKTF